MTSKDIFDRYNKADYVGKPTDVKGTETIFRYKDPISFVEFLEEVDSKGLRKTSQRYSTRTEERKWSGSPSLPAAFDKFKKAKYSNEEAKKSSNLIIKMRQGIKYVDAGDDISVPEYLAGSQEYFIEFQSRNRKKRPILQHPIIINMAANSNADESEMQRAARIIVNKLYEYQVRTPKIVMSYLATDVTGWGDGRNLFIFVEVPYYDFNSLARFTYTSTFRRIAFVNYELVKGLTAGYGTTSQFPLPKTLHDVINIDKFLDFDDEKISKIMDKVITDTFK